MNIRRVQALLALSIVFVSCFISSAQAHSALKSSNPANQEVVEAIPSDISLTFNEDLISIEGESVNTLTLKGADGTSYELLPPTIGGAVLSAQVADGEYPAGDYLLSYRAVSADGHPITGEITFSTKSSTMVESAPATPVTTSLPAEAEDSTFGSSLALIISLAIVFAVVFGIKRKYGSWQK
jgi:methionine-rich copper-binding protein CopC